jgi:hypothetical protein
VTCSPPPSSLSFGDWSGPNGTLISVVYSGPLQEIKKERRTDSVAFRPIWKVQDVGPDSQTWTRMKNMVATSWSRDKEKKMVQRKKSKIHKVMHSNQSTGRPRPSITNVEPRRQCFETFYATDDGNSRIRSTKSVQNTQMPSRRARAKAPTVQVTEGATETLSVCVLLSEEI